ncbi:caspase family protein [Xanthobacter sp. 126]|uniref:caspase family protein n=1 Tax=Xanthobacter sp. 126 TaxID=1131814 RepID=UPI0009E02F86|nr:caspase family protein [Xanthobacter sp. 126]
MAIGISIHLGLNSVDPTHYQGWNGPLNACEFDAKDMALIANSCGFKATTFLTKSATRSNLLSSISNAAKTLSRDDFLLVTYSGHGGQLPDLNGDEDDGLDETWCLYDGQLVDDELYHAFSAIKPGVRILTLADSCHSGTSVKERLLMDTFVNFHPFITSAMKDISGNSLHISRSVYKAMPSDIASRVYLGNKSFYDPILRNPDLKGSLGTVTASGILISGCQDYQLSGDGPFNGVFTGNLKAVWNGGKFSGNYKSFCNSISNRMPPDQTPNLFLFGDSHNKFAVQTPFSL